MGMGRGQEAMEVGGEAREVTLPGEEPRLGLDRDREVSQGCRWGWLVFLIFGPLTTSVSQSLKHLR